MTPITGIRKKEIDRIMQFRRIRLTLAFLATAAVAAACFAQQPVTARVPATPLVVHDPYFSLWSFGDNLNESPTVHWTGTDQRLIAVVRVDGKNWQLMGKRPAESALPQVSREIWPTHVIYHFEGAGIHVELTFFTPALPHDLDVLSRPLTYITWKVHSADGKPHAVQLYFAAGAKLAVNDEHEGVVWGRSRVGDLDVLRIGSNEQPVLQKAGDNLRIDWGWADLAVPQQPNTSLATIGFKEFRQNLESGTLSESDDLDMPRTPRVDLPLLAVRFDLGQVSAAPVSRKVMLAYDDREAIEYFHRRLQDYWRRNRMSMGQMLLAAEQQESSLDARAWSFDKAIVSDLTAVGGEHYAQLAVLAYQQTLGAHKLVADLDGKPLLFSKEDFSNGCVDTVDVTYPAAPFFLLFNPKLLEALLRPVMEYAQMPRWPWPFAPHDIGTYPLANGQVYGGGETSEVDQMPVEESGNMLILFDALAHAEGNADFAREYWPLLTRWAAYLREKGLDPANQLSTDDFAGHLAHNANLSAKAILALGSYAQLADMLGKKEVAQDYGQQARTMASEWVRMAADGDHTKLAFNMQDTWSQKYNLVWDRILGLNLFPPAVAQQEVRFYLAHQNAFGLPLDNRRSYTKLDWTTWSATLATNQADFEALINPLYRYMTTTPTRVPLSDWFDTITGAQVGFQARSVVGGVYIKMLTDPTVWHKWATEPNP